jgi:hypothetical protein
MLEDLPMNAVASRNIKFLGHTDQGGRGDGVQVMVNRGFAYVGHGFSNGITVIDVRDPKNPKPVNFVPCPPNTRAHHLQTATHENFGDLLLAVNGPSVWTMQVSHESYFQGTSGDALAGQKFTTGLRVYDLARPEAPREIAFLPLGGLGPHRIWYVGGRYAYVSVHLPEFSDHILVIVDMAEPTRPEVVGKFWLPGMWTGGGETPTWPKGRRYALHHALVAGNLAYSAWRDGGLALVDIADPAKPKLVCHRNWDPPFGGGTHSPLPLPDRNLLVVADEANFADCSLGLRYVWIFDVRVPANPISIATLPVPDDADYCKKGGNFGPHNLWENRPGALQSSRYIFVTMHNAGVRVYDIANPFQPREAGYFVPPDPERMADPRPNRPRVIQSCDCFVDAQGIMYLTDSNAGLNILQFEGS